PARGEHVIGIADFDDAGTPEDLILHREAALLERREQRILDRFSLLRRHSGAQGSNGNECQYPPPQRNHLGCSRSTIVQGFFGSSFGPAFWVAATSSAFRALSYTRTSSIEAVRPGSWSKLDRPIQFCTGRTLSSVLSPRSSAGLGSLPSMYMCS